ncbi:TPA: hypothetical protein WI722_001897 [Neisseria meningitidis]
MIVIIFINYIINQLFIYDCTELYVPFTTIFANKRKRRIFRRHKTAAPTLPHPVAERNHPHCSKDALQPPHVLPCRCLRAFGQTKYLPEMLFFLKHHDLHEKCRLKNISDGISSLRQ